MRFLYEVFLHLLALYFLKKRKYWKRLKARLGFGFPKVRKGNQPLIWVHAVSLGETKAIAPLVKKLKALECPPIIVLSTVTETGFAEGKKSISEADYHVYLPWDFGYIIRPIIKRIAPDILILTETDFWYNLQNSVKKTGGKVILVNGKLSGRSFNRMLRFPFVSQFLFKDIDLFCVQGNEYAKRFTALGVLEEKIVTTGNIKLDGFTTHEDALPLAGLLGITEKDLVLTLGSTHHPEEEKLLDVVDPLLKKFPTLKVLLVPRHPERFDVVAALLEKRGLKLGRLSHGKQGRITLVDVMGNLRKCYALSHLAFVGGSFTEKVGGHNILEPSSYGVPVICGPYMHGQRGFLDLMLSYEAGVQVSEERLFETFDLFLSDEELRQKVGKNGLKLVLEGKGAIDATMEAIAACVKSESYGNIFSLSRDGAVVSSLGS